MNDAYKQQVRLLLGVLPEVAKENCLAMYGGTAINLFVRDMPRLSVDIDLTFVPLRKKNSMRLVLTQSFLSGNSMVANFVPLWIDSIPGIYST